MRGLRKPHELKLLQGTDRADRDNADAPNPGAAFPDPPERLEGAALAEWERVRGFAAECRGWVRVSDSETLARYCELVAEWTELTAEIREHGHTVRYETSRGSETVQRNPASTARQSIMVELRQVSGELGFSPATRSKVSVEKSEDDDTLSRLLREGG